MRIIKTIFLIILINIQVFSQNDNFNVLKDSIRNLKSYDSLVFFPLIEQAYKVAETTNSKQNKADVLQMIGTWYFFQNKYNTALLYYDSALTLIKYIQDKNFANDIKIKKNTILLNIKANEEIEDSFYNLIEEVINDNDTVSIINAFNSLGNYYDNKKKYDRAIDIYQKALLYANNYSDKYYEISVRNNIAQLAFKIGLMPVARNEFEKLRKMLDNEMNSLLRISIFHNIAVILMNNSNFLEAIKILEEVADYSIQSGIISTYSMALMNIGICYYRQNKYDKAEKYLRKSINELYEHNLTTELQDLYFRVCDMYILSTDYEKGISIYLEAKERINIDSTRVDPVFYIRISRAYEEIGNFKESLMHYKLGSSLLIEKELIKAIEELNIKYAVELKEEQIANQEQAIKLLYSEKKLTQIRFLIYLLSIAIILIFIIAFILINNIKNKRRQQQIFTNNLIKKIDSERERISRDMHDDVGIKITMLRSMLIKGKTENSLDFDSIENLSQELLEMIRSISRNLHPPTLEISGLKNTLINMISSTCKASNIFFSHEITEEIESLSLDIKLHIYRIIQEALNNSLKYSLANNIRLTAEKKNIFFEFIYYDDGVGVNKVKLTAGMGLRNMRERSKIINGDISFTSNNNGVKIILRIYENNKNTNCR